MKTTFIHVCGKLIETVKIIKKQKHLSNQLYKRIACTYFQPAEQLIIISILTHKQEVRNSSVSIVTRYGLDGTGDRIPVGVGARFSAPVQKGPEAHAASYTMGTGSFAGVKRQGRGVDHPLTSSAEVKERAEL